MKNRSGPRSPAGGLPKQGGRRDEYEEERIDLESDPSPDEDDIGDDDDASDATSSSDIDSAALRGR